MPRYDYKCINDTCGAEVEFDLPLNSEKRVEVGAVVFFDDKHCPDCNGDHFLRIWGKKSAPFKFNMRRT